jgi:hypothetical protein
MRLLPRARLRLLALFLTAVSALLAYPARAQSPAPARQWDARFGGQGQEWLTRLVATPDGGYLLAGTTGSRANGDVTRDIRGRERIEPFGAMGYHRHAVIDCWLVKTDARGHKRWDARLGGDYEDLLATVLPTADGGYLLAGTTQSDAGDDVSQPSFEGDWGNADYWLVKLDSLGRRQWDARYGGRGEEELRTALPTPDGGYLLVGTTNSRAGYALSQDTVGRQDYWALKVDATGHAQWDARFGRAGTRCALSDARPTSDGGFLLAGMAQPTAPNTPAHCLLVQLDARGRTRWTTAAPVARTAYLQTEPEVLAVEARGSGFRIRGYSTDTRPDHDYAERWQLRLSPRGRVRGLRHTPDSTLLAAYTVFRRPTPDGGYLLGYHDTNEALADGRQAPDFRVEKYSRRGRRQWTTEFGGNDADLLNSVLPTADGGYLLGGVSRSGAGGAGPSQPGRGGHDFWVVKLAPERPRR